MKKYLCSIFDSAAGTFSAPVVFPSLGVAVRQFGDECQRAESQLHLHPKDFRLQLIGTFDDETALVSQGPEETRVLAQATDYVK